MTREDKVEELEHLLRSGLVRQGSQGYALLQYLGRKAIEEPGEPLKEYTIGVEALHKPAGYDPRIDPTVRVEIGRLRRRLKDYYGARTGGRVRLEIPKGGYSAEFISLTPPPAESRPPEDGASHPHRRWLLIGVLTIVIAGAVLLAATLSRPRLAPALAWFWEPHLRGQSTLLVYGAPLFFKADGAYFRDPQINSVQEAAAHPRLNSLFEALRPSERRPVYHFTGFGEAEAIFRITRLVASAGAQMRIRRSNDVSWDEMRREHVILLGGTKFNRQIADLPYRFKYESVSRRIVNRFPEPGEATEYLTRSDTPHGPITEEYALISVYPGLGPDSRLIVLACSSSEGTGLAAEFITREDTVRVLREKLGRLNAQPFQVVVKGHFKDSILIAVEYVAHAVL